MIHAEFLDGRIVVGDATRRPGYSSILVLDLPSSILKHTPPLSPLASSFARETSATLPHPAHQPAAMKEPPGLAASLALLK
jgi:hypothetical protein